MESIFKADQGTLLEQLAAAGESKLFDLKDGRQVLVHQGQVLETANSRTRPDLDRVCVESLDSFAQFAVGLAEDGENSKFLVQVDGTARVTIKDVSEPEKHQVIFEARCINLLSLTMLHDFVSLETALIQLREGFKPTDMVESLTEQLSSIKIEDLTELKDDGVSLSVGTRTRIVGEGKKETATVFNIELSPIRTFAEAGIVPSKFTMRWKRDGNSVKIRLIEQQHNAWRLAQMKAVAEYLNNLLPDLLVVV